MISAYRGAVMRYLALLLALGCAADPALPTRCTPNATAACVCPGGGTSTQVCSSDGSGYSLCLCDVRDASVDVVEASSPADAPAVEDRPAALDAVAAPDVVAGPDVVDAGAPVDVDPRQTPECRAVNQTCDGRRVNVQGGETDGGITYHCGRCGNTCPAGFGCLTCVCTRL